MQDPGVDCGGSLLGVWGTPAHFGPLNCVLKCVGACRAKTMGYDLYFWGGVTVFWVGW